MQVPGVALQVRQSPSQALSQQRPPTQKLLKHSVPAVQASPSGFLQTPAAHLYPSGQSGVSEQVLTQAPEEQWVPFAQGVVLFILHAPFPSQDQSSVAPAAEHWSLQASVVAPDASLVHVPSEPGRAHEPQPWSPQEATLQQ